VASWGGGLVGWGLVGWGLVGWGLVWAGLVWAGLVGGGPASSPPGTAHDLPSPTRSLRTPLRAAARTAPRPTPGRGRRLDAADAWTRAPPVKPSEAARDPPRFPPHRRPAGRRAAAPAGRPGRCSGVPARASTARHRGAPP